MDGESRECAEKAARAAEKLGLDLADICEGVLDYDRAFVETLAYIADRLESPEGPPGPAPTPAPAPGPQPGQPQVLTAAQRRAQRGR